MYVDDLLLASVSPEEHLKHLQLVFQRLDEYGIVVHVPKSCFGVQELDFLGHHVDAIGIRPLEEKVHVIREFPLPNTQRKLRRFLGLVNFYHRFIPGRTTILQPLHSLLKCTKLPSNSPPWTDATFDRIKHALANATLLVHPVSIAPTSVMTDASDVAVGAVLQQHIIGQWCPLLFFSKALSPAETRCSTYDHELLAFYLSIRHFRYFLEGRDFHVLTDHKPLTYALASRPERHLPQQVWHLDYISQFTSDLRHVQGSANTAADALSRLDTNALHTNDTSVVDFRELALLQVNDPGCVHILPSTSRVSLSSLRES